MRCLPTPVSPVAVAVIATMIVGAAGAAATQVPLRIKVGTQVVAVASNSLAGLGIEDANHQLYGGLYSQMVFGESFEEPAGADGVSGSGVWVVPALPGCFGASQGPTWRRVTGAPSVNIGGAHAGFTGNQSQRLPPGAVVGNSGLLGTGMAFVRGKQYEGYLYARAGAGTAELTIAITVGGVVAAQFTTGAAQWSAQWQRVEFKLTPNASTTCGLTAESANHTATCNAIDSFTGCSDGCVASPELGQRCVACNGQLVVGVARGGGTAVDVDQVFLQPAEWGRFRGLPVRRDLAELMAYGNPSASPPPRGMMAPAIRLGGSMVLCPGYRWKRFRGPRETRQPYAGVWYKYDSPGWKMFEFLDFCQAAGAPSCVVTLPVTETVADLEDLMEYAFGPTTTTYGALRAKDGRPAPLAPFVIEIGNENPLNVTAPLPPGLSPSVCRDSCHNFTARWIERARAMDARAAAFGVSDLTFVVGFDAAAGSSCTQEAIQAGRPAIQELAKLAAGFGERAVWDCHTGGDDPGDGNVTAVAMAELQAVLRSVNSSMRGAVLEENGGTHTMARMLGHVTQTHALTRLGRFIAVNTAATGLQPLGRNSNGWDQGNVFFTPNASWLAPPAMATRMIVSASRGLPDVLDTASGALGALDVVASCSRDRQRLSIRVVNPSGRAVGAVLDVSRWIPGPGAALVRVETLAANSSAAVRVEPVASTQRPPSDGMLSWTFPAGSFVTFAMGVGDE